MAAPANATTERTIQFFRADCGLEESGRPRRFDVEPILQHIEKLPAEIGGRYWLQADGNVLSSWVDAGPNHRRMRLAVVRRSNLPLLENAGALCPLGIASSAGLYEPVHICFFPNNVVGVEFNFYGPRPSQLARYLLAVVPDVTLAFSLDPLLRGDVRRQLARMEQLKVLDIRVRTSYAEAVREADEHLAATLDAVRRVGGSEVVHLILEPEPYRHTYLANRVIRLIRDLLGREDLRQNVLSLSVKGLDNHTGRIEQLDLLKDHLIAHKKIIRQDARTRAVDDEATYTAIEEAYDDLRDDVMLAASLSVG
jgi:hypothetical protein